MLSPPAASRSAMPQPEPPVGKTKQLPHKSVNISAININSITAPDRLQELQHFVDNNDISILALSEMKVDSSIHPSLYTLTGFHTPVIKPRTRKGGGVAVYIRNTIPFSQIYHNIVLLLSAPSYQSRRAGQIFRLSC